MCHGQFKKNNFDPRQNGNEFHVKKIFYPDPLFPLSNNKVVLLVLFTKFKLTVYRVQDCPFQSIAQQTMWRNSSVNRQWIKNVWVFSREATFSPVSTALFFFSILIILKTCLYCEAQIVIVPKPMFYMRLLLT